MFHCVGLVQVLLRLIDNGNSLLFSKREGALGLLFVAVCLSQTYGLKLIVTQIKNSLNSLPADSLQKISKLLTFSEKKVKFYKR